MDDLKDSSMQDAVERLEDLVSAVEDLVSATRKAKVTITPPAVNVPAPVVNVSGPESLPPAVNVHPAITVETPQRSCRIEIASRDQFGRISSLTITPQ